MKRFPFRLGATSYVWPGDIPSNVAQLGPWVDDVELVLFDSAEYGSNVPDAACIAELQRLARVHDLTYTVHLPLDLRSAGNGSALHPSLDKAREVIERTQALAPWAYVGHLDGAGIEGPHRTEDLAAWQAQAADALREVVGWAGDPSRVCVENLESYDVALAEPVLQAVPASRCVDVGHLWLRDVDPLPHLQWWEKRTRVIHLHGLAERDHQSLSGMPPGRLDPVVEWLLQAMRGVVTLEVFGVDDFVTSLDALERSVERCRMRKR